MRDRDEDAAHAFDPIALTLAVWLSMILGATGLIRLSDTAAVDAALARAARRTDFTHVMDGQVVPLPTTTAFDG